MSELCRCGLGLWLSVENPDAAEQARQEADDPPLRAARIFAYSAAHYAGATLERDTWVELDVQHRDQFGRLLGYLCVGGKNLNGRLASKGYAGPLTIPPNAICA